MHRRFRVALLLLVFAGLRSGVLPAADPPLPYGAPLPEATSQPRSAGGVRQLEWSDLLPAGERDRATAAPPAPIHDYLSGEDGPAVSQSTTYSVNTELDGQRVRLPGFIVPLELDAEGRIVEMFLVPYFGACIHVPPPPPNQIVHVTLERGIAVESMYAAFWITGPLEVRRTATRLGASAYRIAAEKVEEYVF